METTLRIVENRCIFPAGVGCSFDLPSTETLACARLRMKQCLSQYSFVAPVHFHQLFILLPILRLSEQGLEFRRSILHPPSSIFHISFAAMGSLGEATQGGYLYKQSHNDAYLTVESASGIWLNLANGQRVLDATCGAAVTSIGHGNARVKKAIMAQLDEVSYCHPGFFRTSIAERLADFLVDSTNGKMARACITGSGSLLSQASSFGVC
jgi:Aminotransferase class-III